MRHLLSCFSFIIYLCALPADAQPSQQRPYRFAPIPMASEAQMTRTYLPFLSYLEQETGEAFELSYFASYQDLLDAFTAGEVDLAYLGPLPYVVLRQQSDAVEPLVQLLDQQGNSQYTCAIVKFLGPPEHHNSSRKVALTQPLSTCGYLAMETYFSRLGKSLEDTDIQYSFTGNHEQVALKVILGQFDLGSMKTRIAQRYQHLGLRVIDQTAPVPGFLLVANRHTLPTETADRIRSRLLALQPLSSETDRRTVQSWSHNLRYGTTPVELSPYDLIAEQWQQIRADLLSEVHTHD